MRFMTIVKSSENLRLGPPPQALMVAIGEMGAAATQDGLMVGMGGLLPTATGARVTLSDGKMAVIDGPFAEAKEVIGGYAIFDLPSKEDAIEWTKRFLGLHTLHWPAWSGEIEVRQMAEGPGDCGAPPA
jgi:hypothetical protein